MLRFRPASAFVLAHVAINVRGRDQVRLPGLLRRKDIVPDLRAERIGTETRTRRRLYQREYFFVPEFHGAILAGIARNRLQF